MKRRISGKILALVGVAAFAALLIGVTLAPDLSPAATGVSPASLDRIGRKNDRAATEAAARMRADSRASAQQADRMRAAEERGRAAADASIAGFEDAEAKARTARQ